MPPRSREERKSDALGRLATDADVWVATADVGGRPFLVPLSLSWDGERVILATEVRSRTARNAVSTRSARHGLGVTRDVVMIDATVEPVPASMATDSIAQVFIDRTGWAPHPPEEWVYLVMKPHRVQAWREVDEIEGREIMRGGRWVV